MTQRPVAYSSWQRNLVAISWLTYASYYLGRVNFNAALPAMETSLGLGKDTLGLLGTGFFWTYAVGQFINGQLGDLISPRRLVFMGMIASALLNLIFSFSSSFLLLLLVWSVNGFFQATGWGPILRTLSNWLDPEQRRRISTVFGTSYILGNAGALLLTGWLVGQFGWRLGFRIPAILFIVAAIIWFVAVRDTPEAAGHQRDWPAGPDRPAGLSWDAVVAGLKDNLRRFWPLSLAGLFVGFCLVSLNTWLPTYFVEVGGVNISQAAALSALSPIAGSFGVIAIGAVVNRYFQGKEAHGLIMTLACLIVLFLLFPFLPPQLLVATIGLMIIGAFISATSSLTLSTLPIVLGGQQNASTLAGLIGLSTNIGAGLSTVIVGTILERSQWTAVFNALALAALAALLLVAVAIFRSRTHILSGEF